MHHVLFLQAGKTGKLKSNAAALYTIPWTGQEPGLGSGKSVIYNLKSESPNRKITACQSKWWCLQRAASLLEQLLAVTCREWEWPGENRLLCQEHGGFLWFTGPRHPPEQDAQTPSSALEISSTWYSMEDTQFLLETRISVKNEVNAVSTGGEGSTGTTD